MRDPSGYTFLTNTDSIGADVKTSGIENEFQSLLSNHIPDDSNRLTALVEMTQRREKREIAASRQQTYRKALSTEKQAVWNQLLMTHSSEFYALKKKAATLPGGVTPCTLCDGEGYMADCIACNNSDGKCVTCNGTGTLSNGDEICPTCVGAGNCYLCNGFKKMLCPFCDDGMIDVQVPLPPEMPPTQ